MPGDILFRLYEGAVYFLNTSIVWFYGTRVIDVLVTTVTKVQITHAQQLYVHICYTEFNTKRTVTVGITSTNAFMAVRGDVMFLTASRLAWN